MDAVKTSVVLNTPERMKGHLLTLCAQIPGLTTILEDAPEVPFLLDVLPALLVNECGASIVFTDKAKGVFDMTRVWELTLYVAPCAPDTGSVQRLTYLSPFLMSIPAFFARRPRLGGGGAGIVSIMLPSDSGNQLATVGDTTYITTTFSMSITTRHQA